MISEIYIRRLLRFYIHFANKGTMVIPSSDFQCVDHSPLRL